MLPRLPSAIPLLLGQSQVGGANPPAIPGNRGHPPPGYHSSIPPCHLGSAWPPQLTPYPGAYTEGLRLMPVCSTLPMGMLVLPQICSLRCAL